jgi:hypothetical protein
MKKVMMVIMFVWVALSFQEGHVAWAERVDSVPVDFRGLYYLVGASTDKGKNIIDINPTMSFRLYADHIKIMGKAPIYFSKISIESGDNVFLLFTENNQLTFWVLCFLKKDYYMIQVIDTDTYQEKRRNIYRVIPEVIK